MSSGHPIRDIKQVVTHLSLECRGEEQTRDMFADRPYRYYLEPRDEVRSSKE